EQHRWLDRQVVRASVKRPERWKLGGQVRAGELVDAVRADEILQAVLAEIDKLHAVREAVADQMVRRFREQDLAAVAGAQHPRRPVQRRPEIIAVTLLGHAGVDGHPYTQRADLAPRFGLEPTLGLDGRRDGVWRPGEHGV